MYNIDFEDNQCETVSVIYDDILNMIGLDPSVMQVMGSYSLARVKQVNRFIPNDCDIFVRAKSKDHFSELVMEKISKLMKQYDNVFFMRKARGRIIDFKIGSNVNFQFIYFHDRYTHVQVSNGFDLTCCKFRTFHVANVWTGERALVTVSNNTYIKDLTLSMRAECHSDKMGDDRVYKYYRRGFKINQIFRIPYKPDWNWMYNNYLVGVDKPILKPLVYYYVFKFVAKLKVLSIRTRENMYKPGGVGFKRARQEFNRQLKRFKN